MHHTIEGIPRAAALVDIENATITEGTRMSLPEASALLGTIAGVTAGIPVRAALAKSLLCAYLLPISAAGWGIDVIEPSPDAADAVLLRRAEELVASGYTDLVVVSGDHAFAALADVARLHVVSHADRLSRRLQARAHTVTLLSASAPSLAA